MAGKNNTKPSDFDSFAERNNLKGDSKTTNTTRKTKDTSSKTGKSSTSTTTGTTEASKCNINATSFTTPNQSNTTTGQASSTRKSSTKGGPTRATSGATSKSQTKNSTVDVSMSQDPSKYDDESDQVESDDSEPGAPALFPSKLADFSTQSANLPESTFTFEKIYNMNNSTVYELAFEERIPIPFEFEVGDVKFESFENSFTIKCSKNHPRNAYLKTASEHHLTYERKFDRPIKEVYMDVGDGVLLVTGEFADFEYPQ